MPLVACLQLRSVDDVEQNLETLDGLMARAARYGARFVLTPENTTWLGDSARKVQIAEPVDGPTHQRLGAMARAHGVWLLVGSVAEAHDGVRCFNTSLLFDDQGELQAHYRKLHRFDIDLPGARFQESATIAAGDSVVVAQTPWGTLGMSICYDVRFPELYRRLVDGGATMISVPSAFTVPTGRDHWHVLLRARAIETQSWIFAPAQEGAHGNGRVSYGHTLIVDPWGTIVAECGDGPGIALAEVDDARLRRIRESMPVRAHRVF